MKKALGSVRVYSRRGRSRSRHPLYEQHLPVKSTSINSVFTVLSQFPTLPPVQVLRGGGEPLLGRAGFRVLVSSAFGLR